MDFKEKIENVTNQRRVVKLEIAELEEVLVKKEELLNRLDGANEILHSLDKEIKSDNENKSEKNKKDSK